MVKDHVCWYYSGHILDLLHPRQNKAKYLLEMELYSFEPDFHRCREAYLPNPVMEIIQIISGNSTHPIFDYSWKSLFSISALRKFHLVEVLKQFIFSQ